jgi:hypothetical protein
LPNTFAPGSTVGTLTDILLPLSIPNEQPETLD